jgi:hypothetical protein
MREMARLATERYGHLDSLAAIRPPYPAQGTPNWWALRLRYRELLSRDVRRHRAGSALRFDEREDIALAAEWSALGNEAADQDYRAMPR